MNKTKPILWSTLTLAAGILLIICNKLISASGIVTLAGLLFIVIGAVNLILYVTRKDELGRRKTTGVALVFGWMVSLAAIILGICMLFFNDTFQQMIPFIFGLIIFLGALTQICLMLFVVRKAAGVAGWLWLFPLGMLILAAVTATQTAGQTDPLIMILTGVAIIVFAVSFITMAILVQHGHKHKAAETPAPVAIPAANNIIKND